MVKELVWHGHHEAAFPIEVLAGSFESRLKTIMTEKAKGEAAWQIERRLQLFKKVQNPPVWLLEAWAEADKAWAEYDKARAELDKARAEYYKVSAELDKARAEYRKAWAKYSKIMAESHNLIRQNLPVLMELHKTECGCGWTPENRNIFKYKD